MKEKRDDLEAQVPRAFETADVESFLAQEGAFAIPFLITSKKDPESTRGLPYYETLKSIRKKDDASLTEDQADTLLLKLMALSHEYAAEPATLEAAEEAHMAVDVVSTLAGKSGPALIEAYRMHVERSAALKGEVKKLRQGEEPLREERRQELSLSVKETLEREIIDLLSHPKIASLYAKSLEEEFEHRRSARGILRKYQSYETVRRDAKHELRVLRANAALARQKTHWGESRKAPGVTPEASALLREVIKTTTKEQERLMHGLSNAGLGILAASELLEYKREDEMSGFVLTPSREALIDEVIDLVSQGARVFLGGPTGTGKTKAAFFAIRELTDGSYDVVAWSGDTTVRDLFGSRDLKMTPGGGIQSVMTKGPYLRAATGEVKGLVDEELTGGQTRVQLSPKYLYALRPGETFNAPGFNGHALTKEEFFHIATGNPLGSRHSEREELDPAIAREFKAIDVPFMPAEEMLHGKLLAHSIEYSGVLPLSRLEIEMLSDLSKAAELSQQAYREQIPQDIIDSDIYKTISPSGVPIRLTKVFLDSGSTADLVSGWRNSGLSIGEYLRENLERFVFRNPHFSEPNLRPEQETMVKILEAYGFNLRNKDTDFYATSNEKLSKKPYLLPSDLGFLIKPPALDDTDPFAQPPADPDTTVAPPHPDRNIPGAPDATSPEARKLKVPDNLIRVEGDELKALMGPEKKVVKVGWAPIPPDQIGSFLANAKKVEPADRKNIKTPTREELATRLNPFLAETYKNFWNYTADQQKAANNKIPELLSPRQIDYSIRKTEDADPEKSGEYILNPDTQTIDFDTYPPEKVKAITLPDSMNGRALDEVAAFIRSSYGEKYYLPGIEYWKWLSENPEKAPPAIEKDQAGNIKTDRYYYMFGSLVRASDGWFVPCSYWGGSGWNRYADRLGDAWDSYCRVLVLEK